MMELCTLQRTAHHAAQRTEKQFLRVCVVALVWLIDIFESYIVHTFSELIDFLFTDDETRAAFSLQEQSWHCVPKFNHILRQFKSRATRQQIVQLFITQWNQQSSGMCVNCCSCCIHAMRGRRSIIVVSCTFVYFSVCDALA